MAARDPRRVNARGRVSDRYLQGTGGSAEGAGGTVGAGVAPGTGVAFVLRGVCTPLRHFPDFKPSVYGPLPFAGANKSRRVASVFVQLTATANAAKSRRESAIFTRRMGPDSFPGVNRPAACREGEYEGQKTVARPIAPATVSPLADDYRHEIGRHRRTNRAHR